MSIFHAGFFGGSIFILIQKRQHRHAQIEIHSLFISLVGRWTSLLLPRKNSKPPSLWFGCITFPWCISQGEKKKWLHLQSGILLIVAFWKIFNSLIMQSWCCPPKNRSGLFSHHFLTESFTPFCCVRAGHYDSAWNVTWRPVHMLPHICCVLWETCDVIGCEQRLQRGIFSHHSECHLHENSDTFQVFFSLS